MMSEMVPPDLHVAYRVRGHYASSFCLNGCRLQCCSSLCGARKIILPTNIPLAKLRHNLQFPCFHCFPRPRSSTELSRLYYRTSSNFSHSIVNLLPFCVYDIIQESSNEHDLIPRCLKSFISCSNSLLNALPVLMLFLQL